MSKTLFVYMTAKDRGEARRIASALVERRLAACANLLGGIESVYRWEGRIERSREVALIAKTQAALFPKLRAAVRALHSYTVPCIVALPVAAGDPPFLRWIEAETAPAPRRRAPKKDNHGGHGEGRKRTETTGR
jgi:periplasmic divalent cation tolerance protein